MERRKRRRGDQRPKGEEMVINFLDLDLVRADEAANIAKEIGVRGMDAIVVQIAKEFGSILISLDGEMVKRAKSVVTVKNVGDL